VRITHLGSPTALIELEGWRLLTDPTFDAPGRVGGHTVRTVITMGTPNM
jgi:L-ascorbate metabolism protein UlaG (beta-lactamase superfamily)